METVGPPPCLDKFKSVVIKIGTHIDRYSNKIDVDRARMNQQLDTYYL